MKKETRIRILETCCILETPKGSHYHMTREQLLAIFFPFKERYFKLISGDSPDADWCVFSTRLGDHHLLRKDEINIFLCIENLGHWPWYPHYNRYGDFGDPRVRVYLYNHIDSIVEDPDQQYIAIPVVHFRIRYFLSIEKAYENQMTCSFSHKKYMLVTNRSGLNKHLDELIRVFSKWGVIDHISQYSDELQGSSCYNSPELLRVMNRYKFVLTLENSYQHGYITEKLFNVFLAKTIPIYCGCPNVERFINPESFLHIPVEESGSSIFMDMFLALMNDEAVYQACVLRQKIAPEYHDEDFLSRYQEYLAKGPRGD